ncbi:hypothetical protein ANN_24057 [Periplaneta americana]|uniref:Uncharacterized protein n=1 Tax=Periplaneta americana TaxID=6978 RepID=A0ABQ8S280_PERAM|nr:hypothetical protein ANN_24057 [Periplaneta americana]
MFAFSSDERAFNIESFSHSIIELQSWNGVANGVDPENTPILCMFMVCAMEVPCVPSLNMNDAFRTEGFHIEEHLLSMGLDERLGIANRAVIYVCLPPPPVYICELKTNVIVVLFYNAYLERESTPVSNGQRVWLRNQVARLESRLGQVTWLRFFPGFSLNPIRANAG